MAFPPLVVSDQIIAAAHINALRNALMVWPGDVDAASHNLSNLGALGAVSGAFSGALSAASVTVTAAVSGATGTFSGALSAGATSVSTLAASGVISAAAKNHIFGSNGGAVGTKADANILLYSVSSSNWAGMGVDTSGNYWVRAGLSSDQIFRINGNGSTQMPGWTWDRPALLGTHYAWFDSLHRLLMKADIPPTSETNGVVIGGQS